jgi:hypothetical protein
MLNRTDLENAARAMNAAAKKLESRQRILRASGDLYTPVRFLFPYFAAVQRWQDEAAKAML